MSVYGYFQLKFGVIGLLLIWLYVCIFTQYKCCCLAALTPARAYVCVQNKNASVITNNMAELLDRI